MNAKKLIACVLTLCMTASIASFPAMADDATYPTRVKVFTMGDSFTQGVIEPNAYRYYIYENLIKDGAVFEFIGPSTSGDFRVTDKYERHGGVGGAVIGDVKDYKWDGSKWVATSHIDYPDTNHTIGGTVNSLHYRLFAGSDGTNDYTKTQYGSYVKNADIVTVFIGLNDYYDGSAGGRSHNLADVLNRYRVIVDRIFEINPDVSLYLTDLPVVGSLRGWTDPNDKNGVYAYNKGILETLVPEYQAKGKNIHGISLNQEAYKWDDATDHPDDDGHPNPKGNRKIGTQIYLGIKDEVLERNKVLTDVVYNPVRVSSLTLNKTSAAMKTGEDLTLEWELLPADAEIISVLFSSSNEQVATVDKYGRVHAVGAGSATITATALDNSEIKATCELTVTSETYKKISDGTNFITEASNLLSSASDWTGNTAQINAASGIFKGSWETIRIEGKKSYDLGANFAMSVGIAMMGCEKHSVNNTNEISNFYASMTVGDFELRATAGSKLLLVYYKGNEVLRHVFKAPVTRENDDRYTVAKYGDTLYLYRNNELLEQAAIDESATLSGNVILYSKGWNPNNFRDVVLKVGVQAPDGTAMPGRITGVTVKDHTWTPMGNDPNVSHDISRLVDGDINTDWQGNLNWGGNISHTFLLELPAEKYVTGMIQHWGSNSGFAKPTNNTKTYFSTDGENWTLMGEYYDPDFVTDGNSTWGATRLVLNYDLDTPTKAKYIKIVSDENGGARSLGAYEFEVRGYNSDPVIVDYTVNCVDNENNMTLGTYTEQAFVGFETTVTPKQIDGYSLLSEPITMRFGTQPQTFTFKYQRKTSAAMGTPTANIRLESSTNKAGLRFRTDFTKDSLFLKVYGNKKYTYSDDALVQFGTLLVPYKLLGSYANVTEMFQAEMSLSESERQVLNVVAKNIYAQTDSTISFTGVLTDIPAAQYKANVCAVGYVRYRTAADQPWTYEFSSQKMQSYAGVAKLARENEYSDEKIKGNAELEAIAAQLDEIIGASNPELPGTVGDDGQGGWIDNGMWY